MQPQAKIRKYEWCTGEVKGANYFCDLKNFIEVQIFFRILIPKIPIIDNLSPMTKTELIKENLGSFMKMLNFLLWNYQQFQQISISSRRKIETPKVH